MVDRALRRAIRQASGFAAISGIKRGYRFSACVPENTPAFQTLGKNRVAEQSSPLGTKERH